MRISNSKLMIFAQALLFALATAMPSAVRADEALAKLAEIAAGRFFLTQTAEGNRIVLEELGRPLSSQGDYEDLLSKLRADTVKKRNANLLDKRIRDLDSRVPSDVESLESDAMFARFKPVAEQAGIELSERAAGGNLDFLPKLPESNFRANARAFVSAQAEARTGLTKFEFDKGVLFKAGDKAKVMQVLQEHGFDFEVGRSFTDVIGNAYAKLAAGGQARSAEEAIEASEKLAKLGKSLEPMIANLSEAGQKSVHFKIADGVLTLQEFKVADFKPVDNFVLTNSNTGYVHLSDYPDYVVGFVKAQAPYTTHPFYGGVLSIQDMRTIASMNEWPLAMKPHDFRHVHFALSHPRAAAVYFKSARAVDPLRFTLISAMYEGVDVAQYGHESALTRHFDSTMHMSQEDAMIWLGKASRQELLDLCGTLNIQSSVDSFSNGIKDWTPSFKGPYSPAGRGGKGLDADLDEAINQFLNFGAKPENKPYLQYNRNASEGQAPLENDERPQHY